MSLAISLCSLNFNSCSTLLNHAKTNNEFLFKVKTFDKPQGFVINKKCKKKSNISYKRLICRAAEYKFPDPIPDFANAETVKFKDHLAKKLSKNKDLFGDDIEDVIGICTEVQRQELQIKTSSKYTLSYHTTTPIRDEYESLIENKTMSFAYPNDYSDLLCCEEDSDRLSVDMPESFSSDIDSSICSVDSQTDESIAEFISEERNYVPGVDYVDRFQSQSLDLSAREKSVSWILKVQAFYGFHPLTAYLSVNYLDRFLYAHRLPKTNGWPMQLLSVACLSLAAKMEETLVPSLVDLQVEDTNYIFESKTIRRMEVLVLSILDWKLRSITPLSYISYFAHKLDPTGVYTEFLVSRATQIILSNIKEASFLEYWPSCIAVSAIICASSDMPRFSLFEPAHAESWCEGLSKEKIMSCYQLMQKNAIDAKITKRQRIPQQLKVITCVTSRSGESSSSSTASPCKRRKLNNSHLCVDDDKY